MAGQKNGRVDGKKPKYFITNKMIYTASRKKECWFFPSTRPFLNYDIYRKI